MGRITKQNLESRGCNSGEIRQYNDTLTALRKKIAGSLALDESFETYYESADGYRFFYQEWGLPKNAPALKGVLVCLHGFLTHSDYFYPFADIFTKLGIKVVALDYRGHGRTGGQMGFRLGYIEKFDLILEDIHLLIYKYQSQHPDVPIYLLGFDLGAIFAMKIRKYYEDIKIKKMILIAPPLDIQLSVKNKISKWFFQFLSKTAKVDSMIQVPAWVRDPHHTYYPEFNEFLNVDKLSINEVAVKTMGDYMNYLAFINRYIEYSDIPVYIFQGSGDTYTNPVAAHKLFQKWKCREKYIRLYENANHNLLFDKFAQEIWQKIQEFILHDTPLQNS